MNNLKISGVVYINLSLKKRSQNKEGGWYICIKRNEQTANSNSLLADLKFQEISGQLLYYFLF